ncbi:MAG: bifunctional UDP-N-acetylglucosamine diphosphorylase/glucosamine-1-phosphate N-acetyltransferase GlmU, partial [Polyangiales bacterium]
MSQPPVTAVVLAAGKGTRMKSATPKVLHSIAGRPMIHYPVRAALEAGADRVVVVVGHGRDRVEPYLRETFGDRVELVVQEEQKGTGHAVLMALPAIGQGRGGKPTPPDARVLVLAGDTPLLRVDDLRELIAAAIADPKADMAMLTATLKDATGYGRIIRKGGFVVAIKEHRDCSEEERSIHEINPAVYAVRYAFLAAQLPKLQPNNAQGELYLTDLIAAAAASGGVVDRTADAASLEGINDRAQLAQLDGRMRAAIIRKHQLAGVTVRDPASTEIHDGVTIGTEVVIERGVVLRGATKIEDGAVLDVGCILTDVTVAAGANLKPYTIASQSKIGPKAQIGPFSHLRPASDVGEDAHVGNFVELKKTRLGKGS